MRNSRTVRIIVSLTVALMLILMLALAIATPPGAHASMPAPERGRDCNITVPKTTVSNDFYSSSTTSFSCTWHNLKGRLVKQRVVIMTIIKTPDSVTTSKAISSVRYYRRKPPRFRSSLSTVTVPIVPDVITLLDPT